MSLFAMAIVGLLTLSIATAGSAEAASTITFSGGTLTFTAGSGAANAVTISLVGDTGYTFIDTADTITLGAGAAGCTGGGTTTVFCPTSAVAPSFLSVNLGNQDDRLTLASLSVSAIVSGGDGNDTITVGSPTGGLDGIDATVTVNGDGHVGSTTSASVICDAATVSATTTLGDTLIVDNRQGSANLGDTATLTATTYQQTGMAQPVTYATIEKVRVLTGSGNEQVNVTGTAASILTEVELGSTGPVAAAVTSTGASSILDVHVSATLVTSIAVTVQGTGNSSVVQVSGGSKQDQLTIEGIGSNSGVHLQGNTEADTLTVRASSATSVVTLDGGAGDDTLSVGTTGNSLDGIVGALCLAGGANDDTLTFNDQGDPSSCSPRP